MPPQLRKRPAKPVSAPKRRKKPKSTSTPQAPVIPHEPWHNRTVEQNYNAALAANDISRMRYFAVLLRERRQKAANDEGPLYAAPELERIASLRRGLRLALYDERTEVSIRAAVEAYRNGEVKVPGEGRANIWLNGELLARDAVFSHKTCDFREFIKEGMDCREFMFKVWPDSGNREVYTEVTRIVIGN